MRLASGRQLEGAGLPTVHLTMTVTRDVLKHASIYSFASIMGKAVGFLMLPFYARIFQTQGYGIVGMVDAAINLLLSLFGYGMGAGLVRIYHEEKDPSKGAVISTGLWLLWMAGGPVIGVLALASRPLSSLLFGDGKFAGFLVLALLALLFDLTGYAAGSYLLIRQRSVSLSVVSVARLLLGLTLNIVLIIVLRWGLAGYFVSSIATAAVNSIALHAIALRACGCKFDRRIARKIVGFEAPLVPGRMVSFISRQLERVLVRYQIGLDSVGVLEMGYKFPPLLSMLISDPFMASWNTKRVELASRGPAAVEIGRMLTYYIFIVGFAGVLLATNLDLLFELLIPREFWSAVRIGRVEIVTTILTGASLHLMFGLYFSKDTRTISLISGTTSIFKVVLSYALISSYGLSGAAYSALVTATVQAVWMTLAGQRSYRVRIEYAKIAVMCGCGFAIAYAAAVADYAQIPVLGRVQAAVPALLAAVCGHETVRRGFPGQILGHLVTGGPTIGRILARTLMASSFLLLGFVVHPRPASAARRFLTGFRRLGSPPMTP